MSSSDHLSRREIIKGACTLYAATALGCAGETTYTQSELTQLEVWRKRADQLETVGEYVYSAEEYPEGMNADVHVPEVTIANGYVTAFIDHVMEKEHWITTIYFRDQTGSVFYLREFLPTEVDEGYDKGVTAYAEIPKGVEEIAAFAFCNKHDHWWSGFLPVN